MKPTMSDDEKRVIVNGGRKLLVTSLQMESRADYIGTNESSFWK
jgi:hypothetical protein